MEVYFSIIIPTLNEQSFIPKLLANLTKQTYSSFEIIIVDGGSTDKTLEKIETFKQSLPITVIINKEKGVSPQRNLGAKRAKGKYFVFFDADVQIPSYFFAKLFESIEKENGLLYTTRLACKSTSQTQIVLTEITNFIIELFNRLGKPFAPGFNIIMERGVFERLNGFDVRLKLAEDHDIVQRARKMGVLLKVLKDPILYLSYRRPERIGYLEFLRQYVTAGMYTVAGEPITKELFEYPMGGHLYKKKPASTTTQKIVLTFRKKIAQLAKTIEFPF